jgi:hypothetical protein
MRVRPAGTGQVEFEQKGIVEVTRGFCRWLVVSGAGLVLAGMGLSSSFAAKEVPPGDTAGVPWIGQPGVTEAVDQIMAREIQNAKGAQRAGVWETHPRLSPGQVLQRNPPTPGMPKPPAVAPPPVFPQPFLPQTLGTSFLGAQLSEAGFIPPDSMGAVGPSQVLVIVNGRIKVFDKSGNLGALNATTDTFFNSVRSAGTSDPHARYDRLTQRWFITMIDVAADNRVLIAVSSGPTITGTASFTFFQFQHDLVGTTPNPDTGGFADYDTLGVDRFALYIGVNVFNAAGTALLGTTGFVVNKSNLFSATLTVTPFRQIGAAGGTGAGPWTPQGVENDDPTATEGYFIGVDNQSFGLLVLRRISNPGGTPSISGNLNLSVPATAFPISQVHKGETGNKNLDALDDRLFAASIRKNKVTGTSSLWTAHNIQVNSSGAASSSGGRNGSRWYEIGNLTGTPSLIQSGTLFDSASSNPRGFWIPSVAASGQGHMALGCSYASVNDFAGVATAGRLRTDSAGSIQGATLAVVSSTAYNLSETPNPHRWGDFSQVVVDPTDDMTLWTFQEYCNAANSWGVRAIQLRAPPPATPASASPASLPQGQSATDVVITGTSVSGSEFFDPGADAGGPGFANRLAAVVNGGGITVNSVTFSSPTSITVNLTVLPSAATGARTITVTNPDGQTATSASGILTITPGVVSVGGTVAYYPTNYPPSALSTNRVGNVTMTVSGSASQSTSTAADGSYSLSNLPIGGTYNVTPSKTDDSTPANGITVADLGLIQAYVLGKRALDPYQLLAADVNTNSSITVADLGLIQALILGKRTTFPAGLWRFVPADYVFPDTNNPWTAPSQQGYPSQTTDVANGDFIAIKLGDVNHSWTPSAGLLNLLVDSPKTGTTLAAAAIPRVAFGASEQGVPAGQTVSVPVTVNGFSRVTSAQFSLAWDPAVLRYLATGSYGLKGVSAGSFGTTLAESGKLAFAWHDSEATGVTLTDGAVLFSVSFEVVGKSGSVSAVTLADSPTPQEVSVDLGEAAFGVKDGSVAVVGPRVMFSNSVYADGQFRLSVATEKGRSYTLEFTDSLNPAKWTALPAVAGEGTTTVLADPAATNQQRFYRVRVR